MKHNNHKPNRNPKAGAPGSERRRHYDQKILELGAKRGAGQL